MRDTVTSLLEVASLAAVVAGVWGLAGWAAAAVVAGMLGLAAAWLVRP